MKKKFKKSMSIILSTLMVVSSLPFVTLTASADSYDATHRSFVQSKIDSNWTGYTGSKVGKFPADSGDGSSYYKNLLYSADCTGYTLTSGVITTGSSWTGSTTSSGDIYLSPNTVMLYDGTTAPQTGILFGGNPNKTSTWSKNDYYHGCYLTNNTDNLSFVNEKWKGSTDSGVKNFVQAMGKGDSVMYSTNKTDQNGDHHTSNNAFGNLLKFKGTFGTNEYTKKIVPTFAYTVNNENNTSSIKTGNMSNDNKSIIYVVNYKPIKDIINSEKLKATWQEVMANESKYTEESVKNYVEASYKVYSLNPTSYDYTKTSDSVSNCGNAIKSAVTDYNSAIEGLKEKVLYTIKFVSARGTTTTQSVEENVMPTAPAAASAKYLGEGQYATYSWPEIKVATEDATYNEIKVVNTYEAYNDYIAKSEEIANINNDNNSYTADSFEAFDSARTNIQNTMNDKEERKTATNDDFAQAIVDMQSAKDLLEVYVAKNFTVTFEFADGTTSDYTYVENTPPSDVRYPSNSSNSFNESSVNGYYANYMHYTWPEVTDVTGNVTYKEIETVTDFDTITDVFIPHTSQMSGYTVCTGNTVDGSHFSWNIQNLDIFPYWQTNDAALEQCNSILNSEDYSSKYTEDSRNAFEKIVADNTIIDSKDVTISMLEASTTALQTASQVLQDVPSIQEYSVIFNVQVDDSEDAAQTETGSYEYGTAKSYTVNPDLLLSSSIVKWTFTTANGATTIVNTTNSSIQTMVTEDVTITCFVKSTPNKETTQTTKVILIDKSNNITSIGYVDNQTILDINNATIDSIGTAKDYAFYNFDSWKVVAGDVSSLNGNDIILKAQYTFVEGNAEQNYSFINGLGDVKINNTTKFKSKYDELVTLLGSREDSQFAICDANGNVISYLPTNYMHTPHQANTYVCEVSKDEVKASTNITGSFVLPREDNKKAVTFNCQVYVPENATLVECGTVATTDESIATDNDAFVKNVQSVYTVKSESQSLTGEYSVVYKSAFSGVDKLYGRSYVVYKDAAGELQTIYSAVNSVTV